MKVGSVFYMVEQGIWNPREQQMNWRQWAVHEDRYDAVRDATKHLLVHRISRCEVIKQSPLPLTQG